MLEKGGEDQLDRSCEKRTDSQEGDEYPVNNKKKKR